MSALVYVDTTIWIYAADTRDPAKQAAARAWLKTLAASNMLIVSPQVATEHHSVASRKLGLSPDVVQRATQAILEFADAPLTRREVAKAMDLVSRQRLSWWDGLHLASAFAAKCTHFLKEGNQGAPVIDGLTILDPFAVEPESLITAKP